MPNFRALGVHIQHNNETDLVWLETKKIAMIKIYKIARSADCRHMACRHRIKILNLTILPYICHRLVPLPVSASRYYQVQKLQRLMYSTIITVRKTAGATKLEAIKDRNGIVTNWITHCPWHQKLAEQTLNYDAHITRAAWRGSRAGLASLHRNEQIETAWANTGRLKRFYQTHVALR